jgi:hypothetical protein
MKLPLIELPQIEPCWTEKEAWGYVARVHDNLIYLQEEAKLGRLEVATDFLLEQSEERSVDCWTRLSALTAIFAANVPRNQILKGPSLRIVIVGDQKSLSRMLKNDS